ncbi:MAG: ABC transporter permease [Planctomycetaceae bacterium]
MKKNLGILMLFIFVFMLTAWQNPNFVNAYNLQNLIQRASLYGIIGIGVSFVIITGGIDLSIGSLIGLVGVTLPFLIVTKEYSLVVGLSAAIGLSLLIGLAHGLLITKLNLQPFVVTLCGLLVYRGCARWLTSDSVQGFGSGFKGLRQLAIGKIPLGDLPAVGNFSLPVPFLLFVALAIIAAIFLNKTIYGRYMLALGRNEQAARYSGINTHSMTILAYVICSVIAGFGALLFAFDSNSIQPDNFGNFYELYAIAAAVLGGCSLRGGEGSIFGVMVGAAILPLLRNSINLLGLPTTLEFAIIGFVILAGVIVDELVKRYAANRRRIAASQLADG